MALHRVILQILHNVAELWNKVLLGTAILHETVSTISHNAIELLQAILRVMLHCVCME